MIMRIIKHETKQQYAVFEWNSVVKDWVRSSSWYSYRENAEQMILSFLRILIPNERNL